MKGASVLVAHKHFNLSVGAVIDVTQSVFLGVMAKTPMSFWFDTAHGSNAYSIRQKVTQDEKHPFTQAHPTM